MERFTTEQRAKIVEFYFRYNCSIVAVQRSYRRFVDNGRIPSKNGIKKLISRFQETGTTAEKPRCGRPKTSRTAIFIERVETSVAAAPKISTRRRSTQLRISRTSLQRILHDDLHYYPYKIQITQKLHATDYDKRMNFTNKFLQLANNEDFINHLIMSDEAHFHLNGYVNKQNQRFWASENPREIFETPLQTAKVTVWCGITSSRIIGPYFFEDVNGNTVSVNGDRYRQMIQEYLLPEIRSMNIADIYFQQDGAPCHTARETIDILKASFSPRLISRFGDIEWPPRSPDLSAPDFFLWGYLKDRVYNAMPNSLQVLKRNIIREIRRITPETLAAVMNSTVARARQCQTQHGGHLKDCVFCT